jgi:hypothetical protein
MAAPVMAETVTLTSEVDGNEVTISYAVTGGTELVRAFGLTIQCEDPCVAITQVVPVDANYRIYPSQIEIDGGTVMDYGTPHDPCSLNDPNIDIEMGSLYTLDANFAGDANAGYNMVPGLAGTLLKFYVEGPNGCFDVNENSITGGVVMEDPCNIPTVISPGGCFDGECYDGMADYAQWELVGKPECWCWARQCLGDADGLPDGKSNFYVSTPDLTILKSYWQIQDGPVGQGACADFDHLPDGKSNFRVSTPDLTILKSYWQIQDGPDGTCLPGNVEP